jgi:hypothetical protein
MGAVWGAASFSILWGYTSIDISRRFVDSLPGLVLLLPVRLVLHAIRVVETEVVHHAFDFSRNHQWIGFVATAVGGVIGGTLYLLARAAMSRVHRARSRREAPPATG